MKPQFSWLIPVVTLALLVGCGKGKEDKTLPAPTFPSSSDAGLVDFYQIPKGTYRVSKIRTHLQFPEARHNASAVVEHLVSSPGNLKDGDTFNYRKDLGTLDKNSQELQMSAEFNLPMTLKANGETTATQTATSFEDRRYYWHYVKSNDAWKWFCSGNQSQGGAKLDLVFRSGTRGTGNNVYLYVDSVGNSLRGTARMAGSSVIFYYEQKQTDGAVIIAEITYSK